MHDRMAVSGMKQLHPEVINSIKSKALFSKQEEKLLIKIPSVSCLQFKFILFWYQMR